MLVHLVNELYLSCLHILGVDDLLHNSSYACDLSIIVDNIREAQFGLTNFTTLSNGHWTSLQGLLISNSVSVLMLSAMPSL